MKDTFDLKWEEIGANADASREMAARMAKQANELGLAMPVPRPIEVDTTEDGLALGFTYSHLDDLRYTSAWRKWHEWDGARWREDKMVRVFELVREFLRDTAGFVPENKRFLRAGRTVASTLTLASSDHRTAMLLEHWDQNDWVLNTPTGLVYLANGQLLTHDPSEYITKITAVGPGGDCPLWKAHIEFVTGSNRELADYIQRWAGYSLTGSNREESLAFLHGGGSNGKDTVVSTLQGILADYSRTAPMETFMASKSDRHPTDLAGLHQARLVVASETRRDSQWDEEKVKWLTGGGVVTARFMRGDFFDFTPKFKLMVMGNTKPSLRHVDVAIRRRLHLIPFRVTIRNPDKEFKMRLRSEWPGILSWCIEGCLAWQRRGLDPPAVVLDATEKYFSAEDRIGTWLEDRCELDPNAEIGSSEAFADWRCWTEAAKEFTGSQKNFSQELLERGLKQKRDNVGRMKFIGFRLKT